jgi:hypothetical protein
VVTQLRTAAVYCLLSQGCDYKGRKRLVFETELQSQYTSHPFFSNCQRRAMSSTKTEALDYKIDIKPVGALNGEIPPVNQSCGCKCSEQVLETPEESIASADSRSHVVHGNDTKVSSWSNVLKIKSKQIA